MLLNLLLIIGIAWVPSIQGQCLEYDSKPPKCTEWIDGDSGNQTVFIEHQFNCSRFWVCQPDLSDCLHECAPADNEGHALYFDVRYQYPYGPVCDWPSNINCDNKPEDCGKCEVWQECVEDGNGGWICIPDCEKHEHCQGDEYCDYPDGGEGHCHKGCRNDGDACGRCGKCDAHMCQEPQCCSNADCPVNHECINGDCHPKCSTDSDCTATPCSTCQNHECFDPECCTDDDCKDNEYCTDANTCELGCNEDSDCSATSCSSCDLNAHQCIDPECCTNNDCTAMTCSECTADNQCYNPECCTDDDCKDTEYCTDANTCELGCNEDSDCSATSCSSCDLNAHQCVDPECCTNNDCTAMACSECTADNQCYNPECCTDDDCDEGVCQDGQCIGCRKDEECDFWNGICTALYDNCNYCESYNSTCTPGCSNDANCNENQLCNGEHRCQEKGGTPSLKTIKFTTDTCDGCQNTNIENGLKLVIERELYNGEMLSCQTNNLDHPNTVDYKANVTTRFDDKESDKIPFGGCYRYKLGAMVTGGRVTWNGDGTWSAVKNRIEFYTSSEVDPPYQCDLSPSTLSPSNREAELTNCQVLQ